MKETVTAHADGRVSFTWEAETDDERTTLEHIPRLLIRREHPSHLEYALRRARLGLATGGEMTPGEMSQLVERALGFLMAQP